MKRLFPFVSLGILDYPVRLLLTLISVMVLLLALNLVMKFHKLLLDSQTPPPPSIGQPAAVAAGDPSVHPFWPEFPHNGTGNFHSSVINGVQVMAEDWNCGASADDVLSYYREQMAARGWEDTTKQTYSLNPELRTTPGNLENDDYINSYRSIMDSTVVFNRDNWSLRISTEPARGFQQINVKFYAVAMPSVVDFFHQMASPLMPNQGPSGKPMDVVQRSGNDLYHTTMTAENEPPAQAFQDAVTDLASKGWKPRAMLPKKQTPNGYFIWLTKGKQYAALSVTVMPDGKSSVTITEVTPH
ncbi:MAG TPA: hypothetical protein VK811_05735 [Candidatus Acidoferrum sp.]|nr:hypothetical protein [Candidatus Acidoferrum sp.]